MDWIFKILSALSSFAVAAAFFIRPVRERIFNFNAVLSGLKCLLRADMLRIYYKHSAENSIRQHERENFESEYKAYKALGGNSFIDDIYQEVKKWEVES